MIALPTTPQWHGMLGEQCRCGSEIIESIKICGGLMNRGSIKSRESIEGRECIAVRTELSDAPLGLDGRCNNGFTETAMSIGGCN